MDFVTLDVFTDKAYGGNPLAVIPDGRGLSTAQMQAIAAEFNYSETTFVLPPADPANTARVRIFTPTMEVPFAGHPLIGTAVALEDRGPDMVFELGIGPRRVSARNGTAEFTTSAVLTTVSEPEAADVAACIGLEAPEIMGQPVHVSLGLPFVLAKLTGPDALAACGPKWEAFRAAAAKYPSELDFAVYAYVEDGPELIARMFAPLDNIPEDPATGSAAATLASFLGPGRYDVRQGEHMGRPSRIEATVAEDEVRVGGAAQRILSGTIDTLPG